MTIKNIKIMGERNSGTNFIYKLIEKNISDEITFLDDTTCWKHGSPSLNNINASETLFIFILRDLHPWLKSMYYNPYNYKRPTNFLEFIQEPLNIIDTDLERKEKIFTKRYTRLQDYNDFIEDNNINVMMINLEDLQDDDGFDFIQILSSTFDISLSYRFTPIVLHTKTNENTINRTYEFQIPNYYIKKFIDKIYEKQIDNLKNKNYLIKIYE